MKFLFTTAFLATLALGQENHAPETDMEDFAYWRGLVDRVDSMPPTSSPTKSPVVSPTDAPVVPTDAPVAPTDAPVTPTDAPVTPTDAPVTPTDAPVAITDVPIAPTDAPVAPTDAPVTPTDSPVAPVSDPTPAPVPPPTEAPIPPATTSPTAVLSPTPCKTIANVLTTTPEFSTLASLVEAAGVVDLMNDATLTLFAPTNDAIAALPSELVDTILGDAELLDLILFGHVVSRQEILVKDLECEGGPISALTMANALEAEISCLLSTDGIGNEVIDTFISDTGLPAKIVGPDGMACNGIVHAIDAVILPEIPATDAPVSETLDPTPAPVAPTVAPITIPTTDAPRPTAAPVAPTDAPVAPTNAPVTPTDAPVAPTDAPVAPTEAPVAPTEAPVVPTEAPVALPPSIEVKLIPFALNGGAEFEDTTSYQYKALRQIEVQIGVDAFTDAKLTQYYALYCLYFATNGVPNVITDADPRFAGIPFPNWLITTGWTETDVDPCEWYGIICDSSSRVSILDLFENLLTGAFPPEIALLSLDGPFATGAGNLYRIDLYRNEFLYNNNDSSWMTDLGSNMTTIIAEETAFSGDIPRLPDFIVNFDISFAYFTGGLTDANFENLEKLTFVDLDGNAFNSTIPSVFGRLPSLEFLYLSDSFLSGDISYMRGMPAIREHWVDTNPGVKGQIFDYIGELSTLESFSMAFNSLTGTIPSTLGNLVNMKQMWLYANELSGVIPTELGNLGAMRILELEGNMFVGSMPAEVCANTAFPTQIFEKLGADCDDENFECSCCTCCSVLECSNAR